MIFVRPYILLLLLLIIPIVVWYVWKRKSISAKMQVSTIEPFLGAKRTYKYYLLHVPFALKMVALAMLIVIMARPQSAKEFDNKNAEGIDVVLSIDISASMLAQDLYPNRLIAAKDVATNFVNERVNDNIGLVVFSGASSSICPLTTDKNALANLITSIDTGMVRAEGTAIGVGLASAVSRLKDSKAKSKVIILLTDGEDNVGKITPLKGAELAKSFGIRVYTIGVGSNGMAPMPTFDKATGKRGIRMEPVVIDEKTLQEIASVTNGLYFRATNTDELKSIYASIDKLEKSKVSVSNFAHRKELFFPFACVALASLLISLVLSSTILRRNP